MIVNNDTNSVGNALVSRMHELVKCATIQQVLDFVDSCIPEGKMNEPKIKQLRYHISASRTTGNAYAVVTNFVLKGDGLGTIK